MSQANIFSLDAVQIEMAPVGCRNPYVRYVSREPLILQPSLDPLAFPEIIRFPTLGFRRFSAHLWCQYPTAVNVGYLHYFFVEKKDISPAKPLCGGVVSPPFDSAVEETEVDAKEVGLRVHTYVGTGATLLMSFSVLVEP